jgi:hypothetical protein
VSPATPATTSPATSPATTSQVTTSPATQDPVSIIKNAPYTDFCSSLLGYGSGGRTSTVTQSVTVTGPTSITGPAQQVTATQVDTLVTLAPQETSTISITPPPEDITTTLVDVVTITNIARRDLSTPGPLATFDASQLSSACSVAVTSPLSVDMLVTAIATTTKTTVVSVDGGTATSQETQTEVQTVSTDPTTDFTTIPVSTNVATLTSTSTTTLCSPYFYLPSPQVILGSRASGPINTQPQYDNDEAVLITPAGLTYNYIAIGDRAFPQLTVSLNGFVTFTSPQLLLNNGYDNAHPANLPEPNLPGNYIFAYWQKMYINSPAAQGIYYQVINGDLFIEYRVALNQPADGSAGEEIHFVISYQEAPDTADGYYEWQWAFIEPGTPPPGSAPAVSGGQYQSALDGREFPACPAPCPLTRPERHAIQLDLSVENMRSFVLQVRDSLIDAAYRLIQSRNDFCIPVAFSRLWYPPPP